MAHPSSPPLAASTPSAVDGAIATQHTQVGGVSRTHDGSGNLTDDGVYLFGYDFQNRLVRVTNKGTSQVVADYPFDALGRRVETAVNGGATTRYLLDGVQVVEEYDSSDAWQARYVYEDGIDRPRCMARADIADVDGDQNTTEVLRFHYHQQELGCVTEMSEPGGAVVEWVVYDVYGQPTIRDRQGSLISQSAIGNPYLYTGREYDPESGLYFYRARHYDPVTGRFLQRDPAGYVDGPGAYAYTRCSPASRRDPRGTHSGREALGAVIRVVSEHGPEWARKAIEEVDGNDGGGFHLESELPWYQLPKGSAGLTKFGNGFDELFEDFPQVIVARKECAVGDVRNRWQQLIMYLLHDLVRVAQEGATGHPLTGPVVPPDPALESTPDTSEEMSREDAWNSQLSEIADRIMAAEEERNRDAPWDRKPH